MASVSLEHALILAAILFAIGFAGLLARRNLIVVLACIEIMLNAAGLAFVVAGARWGQADGQVMFLFVLAMAAAEVAVGLAIAIRFRQAPQVLVMRRMQAESIGQRDRLLVKPFDRRVRNVLHARRLVEQLPVPQLPTGAAGQLPGQRTSSSTVLAGNREHLHEGIPL